jgi:hypothetical protein
MRQAAGICRVGCGAGETLCEAAQTGPDEDDEGGGKFGGEALIGDDAAQIVHDLGEAIG